MELVVRILSKPFDRLGLTLLVALSVVAASGLVLAVG